MEKITTIEQLLKSLNCEFTFPATHVTQEQVEQFGKLTGDWNDHNFTPTAQFPKPGVQGLLSLSLFASFHQQACLIENVDPINVGVLDAKFWKPLFVEQEFTPVLSIHSIEQCYKKEKHYIRATWNYELRDNDSKGFVTAQVELRYYFTVKNQT